MINERRITNVFKNKRTITNKVRKRTMEGGKDGGEGWLL